jgi:CheY-like chemotaxis protein
MLSQTKRGCSILAAEDEEADLIFLKRAFKEISSALQVYSVTDGGEVISYLNGTGVYADRTIFPLPELLLLDLKLPRKTGFEILEWLKDHSTFKRLPAVFLTSSRLSQDVDRAYDLGAAGYFVKQTDPEKFIAQVRVIHQYWCGAVEKPSLHLARRETALAL